MAAAPGLLDTQLTGVSTKNLEAYQLYLHGLEQVRIKSNVSLPKAEVFFEQALAIDPDFHEANTELAVARVEMLVNGTLPVEAALGRIAPMRENMLQNRPDDSVTIWMDVIYRWFENPSAVLADVNYLENIL